MMIRAAPVENGLPVVNQVAGGSSRMPDKDPTETRRDNLTAGRKTNTAHKQAQGAVISNVPRAVATPLPLGLKLR